MEKEKEIIDAEIVDDNTVGAEEEIIVEDILGKQTVKVGDKTIVRVYGEDIVTVELIEQYENMKEYLKGNMELITNAQNAGKRVGVEPFIKPIRGGTDGARLTVRGLPCPNLGAGGRNFHGVYEFICIQDMEKITEILIELVKIYGE